VVAMTHLSATEKKIIHLIAVKNFGPHTLLLKQISELKFENRELTGTGYFIQFEQLPGYLKVDQIKKTASADIRTKLEPPQDVVGFSIFVDHGFIKSFEGYTYGDVTWPNKVLDNGLLLSPF
jgi:hypothetical protein